RRRPAARLDERAGVNRAKTALQLRLDASPEIEAGTGSDRCWSLGPACSSESRSSLLTQVRGAGRLPGLVPGRGEHGEEDRRDDGDNGDHDEQLDQREGCLP